MGVRDFSTVLVTAVVVAATPAHAEEGLLRRLVLKMEQAGAILGDYLGTTEIVVVPPFEPATVTVEMNGTVVATLTSPPYRVETDLGGRPTEHVIRVSASGPGRKRVAWESTINRGKWPLAIQLVRREGRIEALVTAPEADPVVEVEFFHAEHPLGRLTSPPWIVDGPPVHDGLIYAFARTRSGFEAGHGLTPGSELVLRNYQWRNVPIEVSVVDEKGTPLTDLDRSSFRILDGGESGRIVSFSQAFDDPLAIALLIDASKSMTPFMKEVSVAAAQFVNDALQPGDRASVYAIHSVPRLRQRLTDDRGAIQAALGDLTANGNTALWDAIGAAMRELAGEDRRRAIVILSDGQDTDSMATWDETIRSVRLNGIPIYIISFGQALQNPARARDRLTYLTTESGGFLIDATTTKAIQTAYRRIEEDLRARYSIRYEVFSAGDPQEWRPVKVSVSSPRWTTRAISGYFAN